MLRKLVSLVVVSLVIFIAVVGTMPKTAQAGSGSIPVFRMTDWKVPSGEIQVSCPGNTGFDWQIAVDNFDDPAHIFTEQTTAGGTFTIPRDKLQRIGHYNVVARLRCGNENWGQAVTSNTDFDWAGGAPPLPEIPKGYQVAISLSVEFTNVTVGQGVQVTASGRCQDTQGNPQIVRAIRLKDNGAVFYELGSTSATFNWVPKNDGDHTIMAEAACDKDDNWMTTPQASVIVHVVKQPVAPSGGGSSTGSAGNQVTNAGSNNGSGSGQSGNSGNGGSGNSGGSSTTGSTNPPNTGSNIGIDKNGKKFDRTVPFQSGIPSLAQARQQGNPGGVDVSVYCAALGYDSTKTSHAKDGTTNAAYTWKCDGQPIDWNYLCYQVYGDGYVGVNNADANHVGGWKCQQQSSNVRPVQSPSSDTGNNGGSDNGGGQPSSTETNANGKPLTVLPNGDTVYPVAYGTGTPFGQQYVYIQPKYDGLFLRKTPNSDGRSNVIATLNPGDYFPVVQVGDGWILIQTSEGNGWVSAKYAQLHGSTPQKPGPATKEPVISDIQDVPVQLADGTTFTFRYQKSRHWILNGSQFVVSELRKVDSKMQGNLADRLKTLLLYASPVIGQADKNKDIVNFHFCGNDSDCLFNLHYLVGSRLMDTSGVGNIAYGYYIDSLSLPLQMSDLVANWDQLLSSIKAKEFITLRDNPDDVMQRQVGRELKKHGLSEGNLNSIADDLGLY